jgi:asparagine synthase (glutamine-hydrolysing)
LCGIGGILGSDDRATVRKMTNALVHRGPDDSGYFSDRNVAMGHRRLSIIDLATGRQPIFNEDHSIAVIYNGEIYNYRELRNELSAKGHRFATNSDTEVIVHAYEEFGYHCFDTFNGMFTFALWDSKKNELILARDPHGIKPLYFSIVDGRLLFASEAKAILASGLVKPQIDLLSLHYLLNLRYVPGEGTSFRNIFRLPPGSFLRAKSASDYVIERYASNIGGDIPISEGDLVAEVRRVLKSSMERHLISDVPVGFYLSGGIDSSTILALAKGAYPQELLTFSMGFGEENDELISARRVSEIFGTNHKEIVIDGSLLKELPSMVWSVDGPKRNLWHYYLAELASKHVKVVLSGLGGDEIFGGYDFRYRVITKKDGNAILTPAEKIETYLQTLSRDILPLEETTKFYGETLQPMLSYKIPALFETFFANGSPFIQQVFNADMKMKMTHELLLVDDATSMAHSLEVRVPFLDKELVRLCMKIPYDQKFNNSEGKLILKKAMADVLPDFVLKKPKQGFNPDPALVFQKEIKDHAGQHLLDGAGVKEGFFTKDFVVNLLKKKPSTNLRAHYNKLWDMLAFEAWYKLYFIRGEFEHPHMSLDRLLSS